MTDQISTNPKKAQGAAKVQLQLVPPALAIGAAVALGEGAPRYGAFNWRDKPVDASTYIGAIERHLLAYKDGEDVDPESTVGKTHLEGIAACCAILLDSISLGILIDDRKPGKAAQLIRDTNARLALAASKAKPVEAPRFRATDTVMGKPLNADVGSIKAVTDAQAVEVPRTPLTMSEVYDLPDGTPIEVQWLGSNEWMRGLKQSEPAGPLFANGCGQCMELRRVSATGSAGTKVRRAA